ncbi:MAG TPA: DUF1801 domain-containing protein [Ktedonobacteraceae bacterium]|jgi:uncharacterized protein YdhG (YjbR/CyaY superfamily)|nr:DUF1801 domain-containing protein [Ktedonobacteraceae bacterium]
MNAVDTYINALAEPRKSSLRQLRRIILETVPVAEETIQYRMPYYTHHGMLCAFASQKNYMSFYLLDGEIVEKNRHLFEGLSVGKGCIRFKDISQLPEPAIRTMLREVVAANEAHPNDHC